MTNNSTREQAHEQHLRDKSMLERYEAAKQAAQDRLDMVQDEVQQDRQRRQAIRIHQREALSRLSHELKRDLAARLDRLRVELDSSEEEKFQVNTTAIERAFALLQDNARDYIKLGGRI